MSNNMMRALMAGGVLAIGSMMVGCGEEGQKGVFVESKDVPFAVGDKRLRTEVVYSVDGKKESVIVDTKDNIKTLTKARDCKRKGEEAVIRVIPRDSSPGEHTVEFVKTR